MPIAAYTAGAAVVIVAQRVSTISTADEILVGGRVPAELAQEKVEATAPSVSGRVSVHDVADMLARSSDRPRIPAQRRAAQRLLFDR